MGTRKWKKPEAKKVTCKFNEEKIDWAAMFFLQNLLLSKKLLLWAWVDNFPFCVFTVGIIEIDLC